VELDKEEMNLVAVGLDARLLDVVADGPHGVEV
jgi:hypothetical protein